MEHEQRSIDWRFWGGWGVAFLGFPLGGLAALGLVGGIETTGEAVLGGLATGSVIGLAQWLALRSRVALSPWWIAASALGMGVGLATSTALLGIETAGSELVQRAALTGLFVGLAQWLVLRRVVAGSLVWVPVISVAWPLAWIVTRAAGVDLSPHFSVFGATGALTFQLVVGFVLGRLLNRAASQDRRVGRFNQI